MKRYTEEAPITKAVRELELEADRLGLTIEYTCNGLVIHHKSSEATAVYVEADDGRETTEFPCPFETKLLTLDSYLEG